MDRIFTALAQRIAFWAGQPFAFAIALLAILAWAATGPLFGYSDTWQLIVNTTTTIITFLMVFLIQNSQNRDGAAIQAKLDELIRATNTARNQFIGIEHFTESELEQVRAVLEREYGEDGAETAASHKALARLIRRM